MTPQLCDSNSLSSARPYRIVVGVDLSEYSDIVIEHALDQAARHEAPELHFLTVREKRNPSNDELKAALWERVHPALQTFSEYGSKWQARLHVRRGKPCQQLAELAAEIRGDLIVIGDFGAHSRGSTHNSLPNRLLQAAACPTLVVGMTEAADTSEHCAMCADVRESTDGERWFCMPHGDYRELEQPGTLWTPGMLMAA